MGNNSNKKIKNELGAKIGKSFNCPLCNKIFSSNTTFASLNVHIKSCSNKKGMNRNLENKYNYPEPKGDDLEVEINSPSLNINNFYTEGKSFEEKIKTFRNNLECMKIDWREAHCNMELDRTNLLKESIQKYQKIDPYKELKINFKGEVSHDAGGIIREWFTVIIKEIQNCNLNLFERGDTEEFSYIIHRNLTVSSKILEYYNFLGRIIAKALLDNITLNLCFNKIIYKLILGEKIKFEDIVFIDKPLYNSLNEMKKLENIEDLCIYYVVEFRDSQGNLIKDELKENGSNILVKDVNDYIKKRIEYIIKKQKTFVNEIKSGLYKVIPEAFITVFNSDELELLLNGQPFIDVEEWRENTIYQGKYNSNHKVINWFWEGLSDLNQEELSKFFQFCTGSSRVPIGGFSVLESNRGEKAKFCIVENKYNSKCSNFIKAHTCFNRIDLPCFPTEKLVKEALKYVINNEVLGFGID